MFIRKRTRAETNARMRRFRRINRIKFEDMAARTECSGFLLDNIENGNWITHPKIAARICAGYNLDVSDYNNLVHKSHHVNELPDPVPKPRDIVAW